MQKIDNGVAVFCVHEKAQLTVTIFDKDPQATLTAALKTLRWELDKNAEYQLIDYPSKVNLSNRTELRTLDRVIVPTGVSFADLHALQQTLESLKADGVDKSVIRIVPAGIRPIPAHEEGIERIKKLKYKTCPPVPLRSEIENFVDRGGKLSPATRETVQEVILKAIG